MPEETKYEHDPKKWNRVEELLPDFDKPTWLIVCLARDGTEKLAVSSATWMPGRKERERSFNPFNLFGPVKAIPGRWIVGASGWSGSEVIAWFDTDAFYSIGFNNPPKKDENK